MAPTDEHDEDSVLISDEFTNPHKRRAMVEKRARKLKTFTDKVPAPELEGAADADVTLLGWGSTEGVIRDARELLEEQGVKTNQLAIKWLVPFHSDAVSEILGKAKKVLIVENNLSGQFARYLRSETGFSADGHIRKYDGEPFAPHHIVDGVLDHIGDQKVVEDGVFIPFQEILV